MIKTRYWVAIIHPHWLWAYADHEFEDKWAKKV